MLYIFSLLTELILEKARNYKELTLLVKKDMFNKFINGLYLQTAIIIITQKIS